MTNKYFEIGKSTGYDIARTNVHELTADNRDEFLSNMAEHESENYRQYSPFEFLAQEMNRGKNSDSKWENYDNGVIAGIEQAVTERLKELESEGE